MSDDIRRLSEELARDPASLVFLPLGDALRRREQLDHALKIALRGLERHPHNADAHDLLARICVDRGDLERAFDEWDMVVRLDPTHIGARKGMGFVCFRQGRLEQAARYLGEAGAADPADQTIAAALANIRKRLRANEANETSGTNETSQERVEEGQGRTDEGEAAGANERVVTPARAGSRQPRAAPDRGRGAPELSRDPRLLFADLIGEEERTALLLDSQGLVLAGAYVSYEGRDVAQEVGAELSGVSEEARRAMRHLGLGEWTSIRFETEVATVAMAPAPQEGLLLVAASRETPLGLVTRFLDQAVERSRQWLESLR
ncbi:MAG TPA: tetratricopeptide repeat protein [Gemmatimonadaceae bacterium]|nr:tetratricopeptide repeat protein [Gemmatimonadaceae bacterium]